jgi:hypothetical protein
MIIIRNFTKGNKNGIWDVANHIDKGNLKIVVHAHPKRIALCYSGKNQGLYPKPKEAVSNAKLIAAAPRMLDALEAIATMLESEGRLKTIIGKQIMDTIKLAT